MKTFYIFKLKENIKPIAKKRPNNIYLLLNSIYNQNKKDIIIAFNLFDEICMPINSKFFNKYIYDKLKLNELYTKFKNVHMYHDYMNNEESKMIVNKTFVKIKSNKLNNIFIKNINEINDLFICDFNNEFYIYNKFDKK